MKQTKTLLISKELISLIGKTFYVKNLNQICTDVQILESGQIKILSSFFHWNREECDFVALTITK